VGKGGPWTGFTPYPTHGGRQGIRKGKSETCSCPSGVPVKGMGRVKNHGYLQTPASGHLPSRADQNPVSGPHLAFLRWVRGEAGTDRPWAPGGQACPPIAGGPCRGLARGHAQGGQTSALQAHRSWAGCWAGCGAARQATGQGVAGRGAASARATEQFRAEAWVAAGVLGQVVTSGEPLGTQGAGKALLAGVRPVMAGQLIRARKLLVAARPIAGEGTFTWRMESGQQGRAMECS
jgi:hypothetical protein